MTSFTSHGFDDLTTAAFWAGALSGWVNKALRNAHGFAVRLVLVPLLAKTLEGVVHRLKMVNLDVLSEERLQQLTALLVDLHRELARMIEAAGQRRVHWFSVNSSRYVRIEHAAEDLADIIEAISLSQDPAFRTHVDAAIRELRV